MIADRPLITDPAIGGSSDRWATPTLALATFVSGLGTFALGPFLPAIARDLGTSVALLGQVPALAALVAAGLGLMAGPLADRLGHRRSLRWGLASLAVSALGTAAAPSLAVLLGATLVGMVNRAMTSSVAQALAGACFDGDARRRAMGWMKAAVSIALVAGVPLLAAVDAALGWRAALLALALLAGGVAALVGRVLGPDGPPASADLRPRALLAAYRPIAGHGPTLGLIAGNMACTAGTFTLLTYLGAFLAERHGLTIQGIGWVYLAVGVGAVVGSAAAGSRLGARPLRPLLIGANVASGVLVAGALVLPLAAPVVAVLLGLGVAFVAVCGVAIATLLVGETPGGRATTMALSGAAGSLGVALGGGLGGLLLVLGGYSALGLGALLWFVVAAALVWWSRPVPSDGRLDVPGARSVVAPPRAQEAVS